VFCVDEEKRRIQALDRKDPVLPLSPGRAERHGFEYFSATARCPCTRRSTPRTGEVARQDGRATHVCGVRPRFLADIVVNQPAPAKEIHVIADNPLGP